jgi:hypothetical protein
MRTTHRDERDRILSVPLPYEPLPGNFHMFLLNDVHGGNGAMCERSIDKTIHAIRAVKNARVVFQGDQLEAIAITDRRFDVNVHANRLARLDAQRDYFMRLFDSVGDRVLWLLDGNHERKMRNLYTPNADIAKSWNSVYANGTLIKADFGTWKLASWHGAGVVNSRAGDAQQQLTNNLIALKRNMRRLPLDDCDVAACGHYHQCLLHPPVSSLALISKGLTLTHAYSKPARVPIDHHHGLYRIHEDDRYWMCCGGFLAAYAEDMPSYTEDAGYRATELGYGHIQVANGQLKNVEVVKLP